MPQSLPWLVGLLCVLAFPSALAAQGTGAVLPPGGGAISVHVAVTHPSANDQNPGTPDAPLRTIQAGLRLAIQNRRAGLGTRVIVQPGTYRESLDLSAAVPDLSAPAIVLEAAQPRSVVVSGADRWAGWSASATPGVYSSGWPHTWGLAALPAGWEPVAAELVAAPVVRRRELVVVNGTVLRQTVSAGELAQTRNSFFVEEGDGARPGRLWIHVDPLLDLTGAVIEVGVRSTLFELNQMAQVFVRGLVFRHAPTPLHAAAVRINGSRNVRFEDCVVEWNSWGGLAVNQSEAITLHRLDAGRNGATGFGAWRVKDLLVDDVDASDNNWRGAWGNFLGWAVGQKFFNLHGATFRKVRAANNQAVGLWFDTDIADVVIEDSELRGNTHGVLLEVAQGPVLLRNNVIQGNRRIGVFATTAAGVTLEANRILDNETHQIYVPWLADSHFSMVERDFETGALLEVTSRHWRVAGNTVGGSGSTRLLVVGNWPHFLQTFSSAGNVWYHADTPRAFGLYLTKGALPVDRTFDEWRTLTGQEGSSTFASTPPSACSLSVDPTSLSVGAAGGSGLVAVSTSSPVCTWTASADRAWVTLSDGSRGAGAVEFTVHPNPDPTPRSATITIGDRRVVVEQQGNGCDVLLSRTRLVVPAAGIAGALDVGRSTGSCALPVSSDRPWIRTRQSILTGSDPLEYDVSPNPTAASRRGWIRIGAHTIRIVQPGSRSSGQPLDLDGDHVWDVLRYNRTTGAWEAGGGLAAGPSGGGGGWSPGWEIQAADFNGDRRTDFLLYDSETGRWFKVVREGPAFRYEFDDLQPDLTPVVGDFDGDGRSDVFWYGPDSGAWTLLLTGGGVAPRAITGTWSPGWQIQTADWNRDGLTDLFLYDDASGLWFRVTTLPDGTLDYANGSWAPGAAIWPGDFDGDGVTDLFTYREDTGAWSVALTRADGPAPINGQWSPGWTVRVGDLDADGRSDVFLYNPRSGQWFECFSDGRGDFSYVTGSWSPGWQVHLVEPGRPGRAGILLYGLNGVAVQAITNGRGAFEYASAAWGEGWTVVATR